MKTTINITDNSDIENNQEEIYWDYSDEIDEYSLEDDSEYISYLFDNLLCDLYDDDYEI